MRRMIEICNFSLQGTNLSLTDCFAIARNDVKVDPSSRGTKRSLTLVLALLLFFISSAQEKKYPFINYGAGKIIYGKDSSSMMRFYKKMNRFLKGKEKELVIAHIGGSHVQGGFWGDQLMTDFQNLRAPKGGGFFAFPFKIAKSNSPPYYSSFSTGSWKSCRSALAKSHCTNIGMAQLITFTNDSANIFGLKVQENPHHKSFNVIRVYHNFNKSFLYGPKTTEAFRRKEQEAEGYTEFVFDKQLDSLSFDLLRTDTLQKDFILYGFDVRNTSEAGIYYAALGANGASTKSVLKCNLLSQQLKTLSPDLVILSLGVNDVQGKTFSPEEYIERYDSLVTMIKKAAPHCAILFTTTTDNYVRKKGANKKSAATEDCVYQLIQKHGAAMWDMFAVMGGYKSILKWYKAGLARKDKVHFTPKGYHIFADMMFEAIMESYYRNEKN